MQSLSANARCHFDAWPENKCSIYFSVKCEKFQSSVDSASVANSLTSSKRPAFLSAPACGSFKAAAGSLRKRVALPTVFSVSSSA